MVTQSLVYDSICLKEMSGKMHATNFKLREKNVYLILTEGRDKTILDLSNKLAAGSQVFQFVFAIYITKLSCIPKCVFLEPRANTFDTVSEF